MEKEILTNRMRPEHILFCCKKRREKIRKIKNLLKKRKKKKKKKKIDIGVLITSP